MKAGVPRPARSRHSYSSPLGRGGTAVLSGDGEGLHIQRKRIRHTKRRHEQTHGARIGRETSSPDSFGAGYSSLRGLAGIGALTRGNVGLPPGAPRTTSG